MDPSEYASGSGIVDLSEAVKASGTYDAWAPQEVEEIKDGLENVQKKKAKVIFFDAFCRPSADTLNLAPSFRTNERSDRNSRNC
jgi:hypothetical protein